MFAKPRPKKSLLPPPSKKRKASSIEEIAFDNDARHEYLTGFHKRKQQRVKHAQEEAAKRARQEKIESRKLVRMRLPALSCGRASAYRKLYRHEKTASEKSKNT